MAPVRSKKRDSDVLASPARKHAATGSKIPLKDSPSTPRHQRSPIKKRKMGVSLQQKKALIENLQLEITERARRLRAQYHLQAQGLRSRIEIRINRIPTSLRKLKMGDLLLKYMDQDQPRTSVRPPPVPAKDLPSRLSPQKPHQQAARLQQPGRPQKRLSHEISGDKENDVEKGEAVKKRARGADTGNIRPTQVLSPTSSNSRINRDRPASPSKSQIARPTSPLKSSGITRSAAATSVLSSMVEKAKATRAAASRKVTTASSASSSSSGTTAATRTRRTIAPASRPATRAGRRVSDNSETSEASTSTVVRKTGAGRNTTAAPKKSMINNIKKGVTGAAAKKAAAKTAAPASAATTATGRVLRKRG